MLAQIHGAAAGAWMGVVACELVLESFGRDASSRRLVARAHAWIDLLFEGPLVAFVLVTGAVLLARDWPASPLLLLKVAAGLIAVIANLICIPYVRARARATDDAEVRRLFRPIQITGLAIPFGLLALGLGLGAFA